MRRGQTVIGFTEAELGFFLVLVVLGTLVAGSKSPPPDVVPKTEYDSLRHELDRARDSLQKLKSRIMPSCRDKGFAQSILFRVSISGSDQFVLNGSLVSLADLHREFGEQMQAARTRGCIHEIDVMRGRSLTASDLWAGLLRLRRDFRVNLVR